jgi:integrase
VGSLTTTAVEALKASGKTRNERVSLGGSLVARGLSESVRYYFRYKHKGTHHRHPFGDHARNGDMTGSAEFTAFTLSGARARAVTLSALQKEHGDLIGYLREQRQTSQDAVKKATTARQTNEQHTRDYSLSKLCESYWTHLQQQGKPSAQDVRNSLTRWVVKKHAKLATTKASEITTEDILSILRAIIADGKQVTTNRVRSYLSSAYSHGMGSITDPLISSHASGFKLTSNPVLTIKPVAKFEKAGERVLNNGELAELLTRLDKMNSLSSKAVTLSLRLGGQRITQLLAATEYNTDNQTLTLKDIKGRRTHARAHVLPVVSVVEPLIVQAFENPRSRRSGLYGGLTMQTISNEIRGISTLMTKKGSEPFGWRDLRRTCETMLASMGISKDLRAQLQSHGLSGVQERHYDKHSYIDEKRAALEAWNQRLDELKAGKVMASNVVSLERAEAS